MLFPLEKPPTQTLTKIFDILKAAQLIPGLQNHETLTEIGNCYNSRDFERLFVLLGDLERFPCFLILRKELNDVTYFSLFGQALTSECYAGEFPDFTRALLAERPLNFRQHLMSESEQARLVDLPVEFTIYRGVHPGCKPGFSWTLSRDSALFFAKRHIALGRDAGVLRGECMKKDVIAYFEREEEIFIESEKVQNPDPVQLFPRKPKMRSQTTDPKYLAYCRIKEYLTVTGEILSPLLANQYED